MEKGARSIILLSRKMEMEAGEWGKKRSKEGQKGPGTSAKEVSAVKGQSACFWTMLMAMAGDRNDCRAQLLSKAEKTNQTSGFLEVRSWVTLGRRMFYVCVTCYLPLNLIHSLT